MTTKLSRHALSAAVSDLGWRLVLNRLDTAVAVTSMADAVRLAERIVAATDAGHLRLDLRPDAVLVTVDPGDEPLTGADVELARTVSETVARSGARTAVELAGPYSRSVQAVEFAVDAMDIDAVRPFWRAVLGYVDAGDGSLRDPGHQGWSVWFQAMDVPRRQRNRIHFDVVVPHDRAAARIDATLGAGGTLVSDAEAPAFWILADVEGNEVCVCTWQGRDAPVTDAPG
jgi:4a-hydroxytetrahydrobiopterin dehydratase